MGRRRGHLPHRRRLSAARLWMSGAAAWLWMTETAARLALGFGSRHARCGRREKQGRRKNKRRCDVVGERVGSDGRGAYGRPLADQRKKPSSRRKRWTTEFTDFFRF
uniref:Uncharacterized protein n=1 Tax=Arundo donax TaxID=35708 RepID=A0A0A9G513_ARUDO